MPIAELKNVTKKFYTESKVLHRPIGEIVACEDISFYIDCGEIVGLVGESGGGKTTIGKLLVGLLQPDSGIINIDGRDIRSYTKKELSHKVGMIFQDPFGSLNPKLSVGTMLKEVIETKRKSPTIRVAKEKSTLEEIQRLLLAVGLQPDILNYYPHQFSGGQKQRLALSRTLALKPKLIVADEPVSNLDVSIQAQIINLFIDLKKDMKDLSYLFITHDLSLVSYLCDRIIIIQNGRIVEEGLTEEIINSPKSSYTKKLLDAVL
ncbi:MAG: ATP-binding cassette domain-containing protein [Elusimicrobiota bacterium]|nr:ATP-binding cassette domain-containing protein [Elusimicrobiota bacterium]